MQHSMDNSGNNLEGNRTMVEHSMRNKLRFVDNTTQTVNYYLSRGSQTMMGHVTKTTQMVHNQVSKST